MGLAAVRLLIIIALIVVVGVVLVSSTALAQSEECDGARIVVEGGEPSPFILPVRSGDTIKVEPDAVVRIRAEGVLPDSTLRWSVRGFGRRVADFTHELGEFTHTVNVADYSSYTRGLYEVEGTLYVGPKEVCSVLARVNISGFGGVVAVAAVASAGVFGAGALASVPYSARGTTAKLKLKVQARRRRPRGWRRFVPVPAFKRTVFSPYSPFGSNK